MSSLFNIENNTHSARQERVFLLLAGIFLGTLGIINLLGVSRFIDLSFSLGDLNVPLILPLGVLPYPITFLCTDIISEFYGKKRANMVVWVGLIVNLWILSIMWISGLLPPGVPLDPISHLPALEHSDYAFYKIRLYTLGSVVSSMIAYMVAQFLDIHIFHYLRDLTKGKHLWLRNNASTLVSQLIDTTLVITIAYYFTQALPLKEGEVMPQLVTLILSCYVFKAIAALLDTIPCYLAVFGLTRYFNLNASFSPKTQSVSKNQPIRTAYT
jgi:queuosine precursor transporter